VPKDRTALVLDAVRTPTLQVPSFVTPDFLRRYLPLTNRDLRMLHERHGAAINEMTGFEWPKEKPSLDEFYEMLTKALAYPAFLLLFRAYIPSEATERGRGRLPQQFAKQIVSVLREIDSLSEDRPGSDFYPVSHPYFISLFLNDEGAREVATGAYFIFGLFAGWVHTQTLSEMIEDIQAVPECAFDSRLIATREYLLRAVAPLSEIGEATAETPQELNKRLIEDLRPKHSDLDVPTPDDSIDVVTEAVAEARASESPGGASSDDGSSTPSLRTQPTSQVELAPTAIPGTDQEAALDNANTIVPPSAGPAYRQPPSELSEVLQMWHHEAKALVAAADRAAEIGPNDETITQLRSTLEALQWLKSQADNLAARTVATDALVTRLKVQISNIKAALIELLGVADDCVELETSLTNIGGEVSVQAFDTAEDDEKKAAAAFVQATDIGKRIEEIEATHPVMVARRLTSPLLEEQEKHLMDSLHFVRTSVATLVGGSSALTAKTGVATGPAQEPSIPQVPTEAAIVKAADDFISLDEEFPADETPVEIPPAPVVLEQPEPTPVDPLRALVIERLDRLFTLGEFGLAFHLALATNRLMPEFDVVYDPIEFRLAAAAGRYSGLSGQEVEGLLETRNEALAIVQKLDDEATPRSDARRIMLLAGAIPAALFRQDDAGATSLVNQIGSVGPTSPFFQLVEAVDENRKRGYPITAANLAAAAASADEKRFVEESVQEIRKTIDGFKAARFRFSLGERIKHAVLSAHGVISSLERGLDRDTFRAVKDASEALSSREKVLDLLATLTDELDNRHNIDGPARERLVGLFTHIGRQCGDLAASMDELSSLRRNATRIQNIVRLRDEVVTGIERVAHEAVSPSGDVLVDAAYRHAGRVLTDLLPVFRGRGATERDGAPLAVSLHAPLLWLSGLSWTGGWQPSPYDPEAVVNKILAVEVPLLGNDQAASVEKAFEERKAEGAFVPATMLLNIARWYGVPDLRIVTLRAKLEADKDARKANVRARLDQVTRMVDKMRRMAVGGLDQWTRLKETLETIDPARLPVDLAESFLPESISGNRIEDFNSALARIEGVENEAARELRKAEEVYSRRINELCSDEHFDQESGRELRTLLENHELTTLADWLNMMEKGENRRPAGSSGPLNRRLHIFREAMPSLGQIELQHLEAAIRHGDVFGPLNYEGVDDDRREDAANAVAALATLKRSLKSRDSAAQIAALVKETISALFYEVTEVKETDFTQRSRQIYVYDAKVVLPPPDPSSLILPEFGSNTQGAWRIAVIGSGTLSTTELVYLSEGAAHRGVIVFVLGFINKERREQIRLELIRRKRPMLVIDEALIATALSDTEDRRRALLEVAQGYSAADPYKDYGRSPVPPEMFKGRARERSEILDPFGSYVVYGGRRLGKTALLRHIVSHPLPNAAFGFVDLFNVTSEGNVFEKIAQAFGSDVVKSSTRTGQEFGTGIKQWLNSDERRRVLLLLDEADTFVRHEAETGFCCISAMLQLMAETKNRFKFVLAGLHNVSRAVRAENSPLVQISNNPMRIGPLIDRDVADAEFLVRGPLAAMGYEFNRREDVWRILSFTNYYPVLIQIFCQEIVRLLHDQSSQPGARLVRSISTEFVEKTLASPEVRRKLFETFDKTISDIEQRYKLLTYILADRELIERESSMSGEGQTSAEIAEQAMYWWPKAFRAGSDPIEIEYLLEEMEGFGIARRTSLGRFALRSRMLLDLMATDEEDLVNKLEQFRLRDAPPRPFDPKNYRRVLTRVPFKVPSEGRVSPLTDGQEADLLTPGSERPIAVVFGCTAAGIGLVEAALATTRRARDGQVDVEVRSFSSKRDFLNYANRLPSGGRIKILIVTSGSAWTPEWAVEAERLQLIRNGGLRVVFVGGPKQARSWVADPLMRKRDLPSVRKVKLRPWTSSFLAARLEELQVNLDLMADLRSATGGWNELIDQLVVQLGETASSEANRKIAAARSEVLASTSLLADLGVAEDLTSFMRTLAAYADGSTITAKDFQDLCADEKVDPKVVGDYSDLIGLLSFAPDEGAEHLHRRVELNQIALAALTRAE
jgi:hypothetical protein